MSDATTVRKFAGFSFAPWLLTAAGLAAAPLHAQEISSDWQFGATIYGWFPDIGGHTEFPLGGGGDIDVDISTILDHLKMTAQGSFEIQVEYARCRHRRRAAPGQRHGGPGFRPQVHLLDFRGQVPGRRQ